MQDSLDIPTDMNYLCFGLCIYIQNEKRSKMFNANLLNTLILRIKKLEFEFFRNLQSLYLKKN
jgi:hypothetical protein